MFCGLGRAARATEAAAQAQLGHLGRAGPGTVITGPGWAKAPCLMLGHQVAGYMLIFTCGRPPRLCSGGPAYCLLCGRVPTAYWAARCCAAGWAFGLLNTFCVTA